MRHLVLELASKKLGSLLLDPLISSTVHELQNCSNLGFISG
jgi:hypothetical protein